MSKIRLRFAPSPTGVLNVGGVRTALYNYLFAKKQGGDFILRIEDTDQARYVEGAEEYILNALKWCGIMPEEGVGIGGDYGPYRQSERKDIYHRYAQQLVESGHLYYAFDTNEQLDKMRDRMKEQGNHSFLYNAAIRMQMTNSLTLSADEVQRRLKEHVPYTLRLKVPENEEIIIDDIVRGEVRFHSSELDDKVMLKSDGMPTYHLANIIDDHLMKITHVIRGEEWLPSTGHHILLYRAFGWADTMPAFAHLPLILKPTGKGKLSKRDGNKLGIPVFPLSWKGDTPENTFTGFREFGFHPQAVINFLAFLGWNPGTEQELFSMEELVKAFSLERINKSGARFDFEKAKWFNQQYIMNAGRQELAQQVLPFIEAKGHSPSDEYLEEFCHLLKERVVFYTDFWDKGYYFFEDIKDYDDKMIRKKWQPERRPLFEQLRSDLGDLTEFSPELIETVVKLFMEKNGLKFGDVLSVLRLTLSGTMQGPSVFEMAALLGPKTVDKRLKEGFDYCDRTVSDAL